MDKFKRAQACEIGPGGVKCKCCAPHRKDRKKLRRRARRRLKQTDLKLKLGEENG